MAELCLMQYIAFLTLTGTSISLLSYDNAHIDRVQTWIPIESRTDLSLNYFLNTERTCLHLDWNDERLTWIPSEFDEIEGFYINQKLIWIPDIFVINSGGANEEITSMLYVHSNGDVNATVYNRVSFLCLMNASDNH
ncbi:unnamed protein product [Cylicocyclus nassatus]|uniref:Neurotransmitter-gated ion-channel ligand-binding domain-containing protein n=1 Tax=Cylicocyclus nassatus TaxID=53992 RepID=A0AA36M1C1_CYLNA|nr:unnamed protein product [Cylicocyclus nassatus]